MLAEMILLLAWGEWLTGLYWFCLIVGGGLLVISALGAFSSHSDLDFDTDADVDVDFHADFDADVPTDVGVDGALHTDTDALHVDHGSVADASMASVSRWFSIRFVIFFMASFGALGTAFAHLSDLSPGSVLAYSLVGGLIVGQGVHQLFRLIRRTSGDSSTRPGDYVQKLARVTVAVGGSGPGEVAVKVRDTLRYVPARGQSLSADYKPGDEVVVVAYQGGVAQVLSREEFERAYRSQ